MTHPASSDANPASDVPIPTPVPAPPHRDTNRDSAGRAPLRVVLFTDTLGDVNGVSRFIQNVATNALGEGLDLHAVTSTRFDCPHQPNIHNLKPRFARPMPGYSTLDVVVPPGGGLRRVAERIDPHVVHVSTPGPVGAAGWRWAKRRGLPIVGTYHTDFPAYINHLFDDVAMTWVTSRWMRWFYTPMRRVFSRSDDYAKSLAALGVQPQRVERLLPGIDTATFHTRYRDPSVWARMPGVRPDAVKLLYVGRISVEKNLPMLASVWPGVRAACSARGVDAQLIIVGDGPYRAQMEQTLTPHGAAFLGFRHGVELSTIYASSDAFAFPSTTDTLGQVVMEAQSAGLPVLVTDKGGPSEVVDDGRTGFVLRHNDAALWVRTASELLCDPERRAAMGAAGHAKIQPMSIRDSFLHFWRVHEQVRDEV